MKPPIDLNRPTILNIISIVSYCLATMFHIIAYATDSWATLLLDDVRWRLGLWQGCREEDEFCTTAIFDHDIFQSGMSSDWHTGARIMMTLTLIILFFLEFTLIGYTCVKNLEKFRSQLIGTTIALSLSAGILILATLILCAVRAMAAQEGKLEWSYGIVLIAFAFVILSASVVGFDRYKTGQFGKSMRKSKTTSTATLNVEEDQIDYQFSFTNTVVDLALDDSAYF